MGASRLLFALLVVSGLVSYSLQEAISDATNKEIKVGVNGETNVTTNQGEASEVKGIEAIAPLLKFSGNDQNLLTKLASIGKNVKITYKRRSHNKLHSDTKNESHSIDDAKSTPKTEDIYFEESGGHILAEPIVYHKSYGYSKAAKQHGQKFSSDGNENIGQGFKFRNADKNGGNHKHSSKSSVKKVFYLRNDPTAVYSKHTSKSNSKTPIIKLRESDEGTNDSNEYIGNGSPENDVDEEINNVNTTSNDDSGAISSEEDLLKLLHSLNKVIRKKASSQKDIGIENFIDFGDLNWEDTLKDEITKNSDVRGLESASLEDYDDNPTDEVITNDVLNSDDSFVKYGTENRKDIANGGDLKTGPVKAQKPPLPSETSGVKKIKISYTNNPESSTGNDDPDEGESETDDENDLSAEPSSDFSGKITITSHASQIPHRHESHKPSTNREELFENLVTRIRLLAKKLLSLKRKPNSFAIKKTKHISYELKLLYRYLKSLMIESDETSEPDDDDDIEDEQRTNEEKLPKKKSNIDLKHNVSLVLKLLQLLKRWKENNTDSPISSSEYQRLTQIFKIYLKITKSNPKAKTNLLFRILDYIRNKIRNYKIPERNNHLERKIRLKIELLLSTLLKRLKENSKNDVDKQKEKRYHPGDLESDEENDVDDDNIFTEKLDLNVVDKTPYIDDNFDSDEDTDTLENLKRINIIKLIDSFAKYEFNVKDRINLNNIIEVKRSSNDKRLENYFEVVIIKSIRPYFHGKSITIANIQKLLAHFYSKLLSVRKQSCKIYAYRKMTKAALNFLQFTSKWIAARSTG